MILPDIWSKDDAVAARTFFNSAAWLKMYQILMSPAGRPTIQGKDKDERYENSIRREQHEITLNMLTEFKDSPEKQEPDRPANIDFSSMSSKKFEGDIPPELKSKY